MYGSGLRPRVSTIYVTLCTTSISYPLIPFLCAYAGKNHHQLRWPRRWQWGERERKWPAHNNKKKDSEDKAKRYNCWEIFCALQICSWLHVIIAGLPPHWTNPSRLRLFLRSLPYSTGIFPIQPPKAASARNQNYVLSCMDAITVALCNTWGNTQRDVAARRVG